MTKPPAGDPDLTRYLLGQKSEEEQTGLEEKYFADDELFEKLVEAQHDLVDAYLAGGLTPAQRRQFEEHFLATGAASEEVKFAAALRRFVDAQGRAQRVRRARRSGTILTVIALVFTGAAVWWFMKPAERAGPLVERPRAPVQQQRQVLPQPRAAPVVTVLLTPGSTRGSGTSQPLQLRGEAQFVRLELLLDDTRYDSFRLELQDVDGHRLWEQGSLHRDGTKVIAEVPARLLQPGDYIVLLHGMRNASNQDIGNYSFTVAAAPAWPAQ